MTESSGRPGLAGLPANLLVRGRRVVVVGGGRIAARKIAPLLDLGAVVEVVAPEPGDEVRAWADAGRLVLHRRGFAPDDLRDAWLAFTATDDPTVNAAVHTAAEAARVWVNSADDPANCSFTLMSVIRRADLVVTVGTGGRSPALAAHLRRVWEDELGPEYEILLDLLATEREAVRAAGRSTEGLDWQKALNSDMLDLIREGHVAHARERLQACLSSPSD